MLTNMKCKNGWSNFPSSFIAVALKLTVKNLMHVAKPLFFFNILGAVTQGILTYRRYTQREFKLKFSALLKSYDGKCTEKKVKNNFSNKHCRMIRVTGRNIS